MAYPGIQALMDEIGLELDDIRWHLAVQLADELLGMQGEPLRLVERIWSGALADRLFNLEEQELEALEAQWSADQCGEARIREFLLEARAAKRRRRPFRPSDAAS